MRFRGARDNTLAQVVGMVAVIVVVALIWILFLAPR
jgi:hypothetical protein